MGKRKKKNSQAMTDQFAGIASDTTVVHNEAKRQISILDSAKDPYFKATRNLDRVIHETITPVNESLVTVRNEYQKRIDDQGCRSDLFWRVVGIATQESTGPGIGTIVYTVQCTKLSPVYSKSDAVGMTSEAVATASTVGFTTNAILKFDGAGSFSNFPMEDAGDNLISAGSGMDVFLEPDNFHGIKMYDEPYARDVFDTFRSVGVGTVGIGTLASTNPLTILSPVDTMDIKTGYIMTPSKSGFFATGSVNVIGVGTTMADLSPYPFSGIATSKPVVVPTVFVDQLPVGVCSAPTLDGDFVNFTFTQNPSTIDDSFALSQQDNPYVNQTLEIMTYERSGNGVEIKYDNSGIASGTRSWNKFYDGFVDPAVVEEMDEDDDISDAPIVREPALGADMIHYPVGFTEEPTLSGSPASEGDVTTFTNLSFVYTAGYQSLPSCDDTDLNAAISARDTLESELAANNEFDEMIATSNSVKDKLNNEYNLRIWAYRVQMGEANERKAVFGNFDNMIKNSKFGEIMDRGSFDDD